jgi:hypothetical protein
MPDRRLVELRKSEDRLLAAQERRDEYQGQEEEAPFRREIGLARFQQPPAPAERALADRVENDVVFLIAFVKSPAV